MAKRQRTRPGQRRPATRPARPSGRPSGQPRPAGSLTAAEESRAAELEAEIVAREKQVEATRSRSAERRRSETNLGVGPRSREGSLLAVRAEEEYAYVVRDARRILRVGGSLVAILAALFVLIDVIGAIRL